jgi:hypothetical protein
MTSSSRELAYLMRGLYKPSDLERILEARIAVSGAGGSIGTYLCDVLTRKGFNKFNISDPDNYEKRNLSRQLCATTQTLGQNKAQAVKIHMLDINPEAEIKVFDAIGLTNILEFLDGADVCAYQAEGLVPWVATVYACEKTGLPFVNMSRKERQRTTMRLRIMNYGKNPPCRVEEINFASFGIEESMAIKMIEALKKEDLENPIFAEAEKVHSTYKKKYRFTDLHKEYPSAGDIRSEFPDDYLKRYTDPEMTFTGAALAARAITDIVIGKDPKIYELDIFPDER